MSLNGYDNGRVIKFDDVHLGRPQVDAPDARSSNKLMDLEVCLRTCSVWIPDKRPPDKKNTGQKTTKDANPGQKATWTKDHPDKRPPSSSKLVFYLTI